MTDQPKWTPGPWIVFTSEDEWGCDTFVGTLTDTLFDVRPWKGPAWQNGNAHLIAAAPDLYAALDGLLGLLDAGSLYEPQAYAARAALAKARGETK